MEETGRVLIVDDEPNIISSLRRLFISEGLEVFTASGAEEGMEILKSHDVDLVLSDYKMPEINGIQFLTMVRSAYPGVFRAILSGYVETDTITYAIGKGIAMAYFKKPWSDYSLTEKVRHIISTMRRIKNTGLIKIFNSIDKLPSIPKIYYQLDDAVNRGESIENIAAIFKHDVSLTAKILQIGNSVFYSGKGHSTLEQAILMIGLNTIKEIVLMYKFTDGLNISPDVYKDLSAIFCRGLKVNKASEHILLTSGRKYDRGVSGTIGLLSFVGQIILLCYEPERYLKITEVMKNSGMTFSEAEKSLGYTEDTNTRITCHFLDLYNMPFNVLEILLYRDEPEKISSENRIIAYAVNAAEKLTAAVKAGIETDDSFFSSLSCGVLDKDKLKNTMKMIKEVMNA